MSDEAKKVCQDCNHEAEKHNILKEPYGRLCISCIDEGDSDPCRNIFQ